MGLRKKGCTPSSLCAFACVRYGGGLQQQQQPARIHSRISALTRKRRTHRRGAAAVDVPAAHVQPRNEGDAASSYQRTSFDTQSRSQLAF